VHSDVALSAEENLDSFFDFLGDDPIEGDEADVAVSLPDFLGGGFVPAHQINQL
jgi:hypothetical protein